MVHSRSTDPEYDPNPSPPRRDFLRWVSSITMGGGLLASYGTFAAMAGRYLYSDDEESDWQFVALAREIKLGEARQYITPAGAKVVVARQSEDETDEAFAALSSTCPHLGCQVHWEPQNKRFFCPCHNGAFDPDGTAIAGPPAQARQSLIRFQLKLVDGLLYVRVPSRALSLAKES